MSATKDIQILNKNEQQDICKQLAEFKDVNEVVEYVRDSFGKEITYGAVRRYLYSPKWKPLIERLRQEYVTPIMNIPVSHKFVRLKRREELYQVNSSNNNHRLCREILNDAQAELEGPKNNQSGNLFITQINNISDEELERKKRDLMEKVINVKAKEKE